MPKLSIARANWPILNGLSLISRGKTRDVYDLGGSLLLIVTTDAVSIFDIILNTLIPGKGIVLNVLSTFWLNLLRDELGINTHFVAAGVAIDKHLPEHLRGDVDLQSRAMVVRKLTMDPVEYIARGYLTGSGLKAYNRDRMVCGQKLPSGLQDGDKIPTLFTPTTKAAEGHDEHVPTLDIVRQYPEQAFLTNLIYQFGGDLAERYGVIVADTKFEFGRDEEGRVCLGDEVLDSDSSRYWSASEWLTSRQVKGSRKAPRSYDKDNVRRHGISCGMDPSAKLTDETIAAAQLIDFSSVIQPTSQAYRYMLWRLTGKTVESYLRTFMGVGAPSPQKRVAVVLGSRSDLPIVESIIREARAEGKFESVCVHVISCHRNPNALQEYIDITIDADVVIAAGGKALALPGVLDALLFAAGKNIPVVGVALGEPGSQALRAAELSIEELPGAPVIIDEIAGKAYSGPAGFVAALNRLHSGELPPPQPRKVAEPEFNVPI